jgi:hypothetical protein
LCVCCRQGRIQRGNQSEIGCFDGIVGVGVGVNQGRIVIGGNDKQRVSTITSCCTTAEVI